MALVTKYFSTAANGTGLGTDWDNRAALLDGSGNWSSVITGHAFGSDALRCLIGPGTYNLTQTMVSGIFGTNPGPGTPLIFLGCQTGGTPLEPPTAWQSAQPDFDFSAYPTIATTSNTISVNLGNTIFQHIRWTATSRTSGYMLGSTTLDWCVVENSSSGTGAYSLQGSAVYNSIIKMTGSSFQQAVQTSGTEVVNCRIVGVAGSSGNRDGVSWTSTASTIIGTRNTIIGFGGSGWGNGGTIGGQDSRLNRNTIYGCGSHGVYFTTGVSHTDRHRVNQCMIVANGGYGIEGGSCNVHSTNNRIRNNTSGSHNNFTNHPTDRDNTAAGTDAAEFVNVAGGDYRIKYGSSLWGQGIGAGDEPAPTASEIAASVWARVGRTLTS